MRKKRILSEGEGYYHVISRIVNKEFMFTEEEKDLFVDFMRRAEEFSGVEVVTFCVMSNHFHILLHVPLPKTVDDEELERRVRILYGDINAQNMFDQWERWRKTGMSCMEDDARARLRARMYNLAEFVKTLKMRYTVSYNARHGHEGTIWENRFKSILLEGEHHTLVGTAAYIDLNPVRAEIVKRPEEYRWSGYSEAFFAMKKARQGLLLVPLKDAVAKSWKEFHPAYRMFLYVLGQERKDVSGNVTKCGFPSQEVRRVLDAGGKVTVAEILQLKSAWQIKARVLGQRTFVIQTIARNPECFGHLRPPVPHPLPGADWGGVCAARNVRKNGFTLPKTA